MNSTNQTQTKNNIKFKTTDLVMTGMFAALICIVSPFSIPTQIVPFTLSLLAVFLTGAILSPRYAVLATLTYLLIGLCGVPVFSNFTGGFQKLIGPTGGYLVSYPLIALIVSLASTYCKKYKAIVLSVAMLVSLIICYFLGTLWFIHVLPGNTFYGALLICVIPYIPFDLLKIALAVSLSLVLKKIIAKNSFR